MSEELDEGERADWEWNDRHERMDRFLKETFPELDKLALIKWVEDWLFCQHEVDEYDYQAGCYRRALEMFDLQSPVERSASGFGDFIQPAIEAYFEKKAALSDTEKLAIIFEILDRY